MHCSHALLGMCLHGLGQYYLIVGQHREAGEAFSEAVGIAKDIYGPEDIQVATCTFAYYNNWCSSSFDTGKAK